MAAVAAVAVAEITVVVAALPPGVDRIVLAAAICQVVVEALAVAAAVHLAVDQDHVVVIADPVHAAVAAGVDPVQADLVEADRVVVAAVAGDNHDWEEYI